MVLSIGTAGALLEWGMSMGGDEVLREIVVRMVCCGINQSRLHMIHIFGKFNGGAAICRGGGELIT